MMLGMQSAESCCTCRMMSGTYAYMLAQTPFPRLGCQWLHPMLSMAMSTHQFMLCLLFPAGVEAHVPDF